MWAHVSRAAADDSGAVGPVLPAVDSVQVVYCQSWQYDDPPGRLAQRLGVPEGARHYSGIGGSTPQMLVDETAEAILTGELELALIVGGEALATKRALRKKNQRPDWSHRNPTKVPFPIENMPPAAEVNHEVFQAYLTFALFDSARRPSAGIGVAEHPQRVGELLAPMSSVAEANSEAWYRLHRSASEIATPTDANRMVAYPYTKYAVAVMDVDQAGALLLASEATADALGVPREHRVYLRGFGAARDPYVIAARDDLGRSPGMEVAGSAALEGAGITVDELAHIDLYSCFASSIWFATDALGLSTEDPRHLTVTGGLPFFGGPGSSYMLRSMAQMVGRLREDEGTHGLVSGVGMHMEKHAFAVYSTQPGRLVPPDKSELQARTDDVARPREVRDTPQGAATVAAYSVLHGRDGAPERGVAIIELPDGARSYAQVADPETLGDIERNELVGAKVEVTTDETVNTLHL